MSDISTFPTAAHIQQSPAQVQHWGAPAGCGFPDYLLDFPDPVDHLCLSKPDRHAGHPNADPKESGFGNYLTLLRIGSVPVLDLVFKFTQNRHDHIRGFAFNHHGGRICLLALSLPRSPDDAQSPLADQCISQPTGAGSHVPDDLPGW